MKNKQIAKIPRRESKGMTVARMNQIEAVVILLMEVTEENVNVEGMIVMFPVKRKKIITEKAIKSIKKEQE